MMTDVLHPSFLTKEIDAHRGLGLSKNILEEGGNLSVPKTTPHKSSIIEISIPLSSINDGKEVKEAEDVSTLQKKLKLLWVDDDLSISRIVGEMIKMLGHQADVANSAEDALKLLEHNSYDLVITDIGMPDMNGWQLADIINEKYDGKMKVAVISGWEKKNDDETLKHGVSFYITKPFGMTQLRNLVKEIEG